MLEIRQFDHKRLLLTITDEVSNHGFNVYSFQYSRCVSKTLQKEYAMIYTIQKIARLLTLFRQDHRTGFWGQPSC